MATEVLEPKFWNKKTRKVEVDNVELSKRTTTLDSILGTYRWFYYSFPHRDEDIEPDSGYITLGKSKAKATPANIVGSVKLHVLNGTFKGVMRAKEKYHERKYRKNFWEIKKMEWNEEEQNGFGVCEVKDDNGHPFLKFEMGDPEVYDCHGSDFAFYLGKKVDTLSGEEDSDKCELTEDEQIRLGMAFSETEVEELATKGYISDSDEDLVGISESDGADEERGIKRKHVTGGEGGNKRVRKA